MKKLLLIAIATFSLLAFKSNNSNNSDEVITALKSGHAANMAQYFDSFIDLSLPDKDEVKNIGKNQASIALKSYYDEIGVKSFQLTSQREAGSIMYITGKLQGKIKNPNITLILKNANNKYLITSVRIG